MEPANDMQCIDAVKNGNTEAFGYIVNKYKRLVFTIVVKIVNDRHTAEDVTQEVFIKAFKSLGNFRSEASFSTWLYRIAYNTGITVVRKKKINFVLESERYDIADNDDDLLYNDIPKEHLLKHLENVVSELPAADALLINLFYQGQQSIEQISEIADLSTANVKVKLHRIRKKMQDELTKRIKYE